MQFLAKLLFKLLGWSYDEKPELWSDKQVVIGFPHTTNMDAVRSLIMFKALGIRTSTMIKKELFRGATGVLLKAMHCIPVDRSSSTNVVDQVADIFNQSDKSTLVLAPEGTRSKNGEKGQIKTGFWHIAKAADVPVVLMMSDNKAQRGRFLGRVTPGDNIEDDLKQIKAIYLDAGLDI